MKMTKKIIVALQFLVLVATASVFTACGDLTENEPVATSEKCIVTFSAENAARQAMPAQLDKEKLTYMLIYTNTADSTKKGSLGQSDPISYTELTSTELELSEGEWIFTLRAYNGSLSALTANVTKTISAGTNTIAFTMEEVETGVGSIAIHVVYPYDKDTANTTGVTAALYTFPAGEEVTGSTKTLTSEIFTDENGEDMSRVFYTLDSVASGTYYAKFTFSDGIVWPVFVIVAPGNTSTSTEYKSITVEEEFVEQTLTGTSEKISGTFVLSTSGDGTYIITHKEKGTVAKGTYRMVDESLFVTETHYVDLLNDGTTLVAVVSPAEKELTLSADSTFTYTTTGGVAITFVGGHVPSGAMEFSITLNTASVPSADLYQVTIFAVNSSGYEPMSKFSSFSTDLEKATALINTVTNENTGKYLNSYTPKIIDYDSTTDYSNPVYITNPCMTVSSDGTSIVINDSYTAYGALQKDATTAIVAFVQYGAESQAFSAVRVGCSDSFTTSSTNTVELSMASMPVPVQVNFFVGENPNLLSSTAIVADGEWIADLPTIAKDSSILGTKLAAYIRENSYENATIPTSGSYVYNGIPCFAVRVEKTGNTYSGTFTKDGATYNATLSVYAKTETSGIYSIFCETSDYGSLLISAGTYTNSGTKVTALETNYRTEYTSSATLYGAYDVSEQTFDASADTFTVTSGSGGSFTVKTATTSGITVTLGTFDDDTVTETIKLTQEDVTDDEGNVTGVRITATEGFASYVWIVDGEEITGTTGSAVSTSNVCEILVENYSAGTHDLTLTVTVEDDANSPYSVTSTFTITK